MNYSYSDLGGHLSINHWSNGNALWSRGPPLSPAVLTISYVKAYFNSTDSARQQAYAEQCTDNTDVCIVPEEYVRTDPTRFIDGKMCGEGNLEASVTPSSTTSSNPSSTISPSATETVPLAASPTSGATTGRSLRCPWWARFFVFSGYVLLKQFL